MSIEKKVYKQKDHVQRISQRGRQRGSQQYNRYFQAENIRCGVIFGHKSKRILPQDKSNSSISRHHGQKTLQYHGSPFLYNIPDTGSVLL